MQSRLSSLFFPLTLLVIGCLLVTVSFVLQTTPASSAVSDPSVSVAKSSTLVLDAPPPYCPHPTGPNPGNGNGNGRGRGRPCGPKAP